MRNSITSEALHRYHRVSQECISAVTAELLRHHGPAFSLVPRHATHSVNCDTGNGPFTLMVTQVLVDSTGLTLVGNPEHCEYDASDWQLRDLVSNEAKLELLASFFDEGRWTRIA